MVDIIVAGIGTGVGKTVVSAIITTLLKGDYWKPIQSGEVDADSQVIAKLLPLECTVHPPTYSFKAPLSPHHAARLENQTIDPDRIIPPETNHPLVIEMAGGIFVPLRENLLSLDLFKSWNAHWILVSKHYLGSINHTLLTIETLITHQVEILGIVFNGRPNPDSENAILKFSHVPLLERIFPEKTIDSSKIQRYAKQWQQSGIHLLK
ncbi:MAG: dethiobiotin synthase [Candidatus Neptunochlamydia sp.]|nr:dethiobiotin synthase [Candidatus Neptunochlamydia sp.]